MFRTATDIEANITPTTNDTPLDVVLFELPANAHIYPAFSILSIPIPHSTLSSSATFRHVLAITEVHTPAANAASDVETPVHYSPIVRTHYFYSTEPVIFTEFTDLRLFFREMQDKLRSGQLIMACPWATHALNTPAHVRNYQDFVSSYLQDQVSPADCSAFWEALYGLYEHNEILQHPCEAPFINPTDFSSNASQLQFMRNVPFVHEGSRLPATTPGDAHYSTAISEGMFGPTGVLRAVRTAGESVFMARAVIMGQRGIDGAIATNFDRPIGIANAVLWGTGLLFEDIDFLSHLNKSSHKSVDTWLYGSSLLCNNTMCASFIHGGLTNTPVSFVVGSAAGVGASTLYTIMDARSIYQMSHKKSDIAKCLTTLEAYFAAAQDAYITGQVAREMKDNQYKWHPECASLYVMIRWLARKYQRCITGKKLLSLPHNIAQIAIGIGILVTAIGSTVATNGILLAIGAGLGLFYFGATSVGAYKRYANNAATYQDYQRVIQQLQTEARITPEEFAQEQWLFGLTSQLHPYRHKMKGATIGDYFRCKIAAFVIMGKQKLAELRTQTEFNERAKLIILCVDTLGDAIGYNESAHGHYVSQSDLGAKVLRLAGQIPIRGY